jgi:signal peptidase I
MNSKTRQRCRIRLAAFWKGWVKPIAVVVIVLSTFRSAVADWNDVPTGSMRPTILEGDRIFVNKLAYDLKVPFTTWHLLEWADPQTGDIVVCFAPDSGERLVKRVVALPGDTVEMRNNVLLVNGQPAMYQPVTGVSGPSGGARWMDETVGGRTHAILLSPGVRAMRSFPQTRVPAGQYFVLGDNRDQSRDSRFFGFVDRREIVGRTSAIVLSLAPDRYYLPRWERFLHRLR